ncbi:hypothetical protein MES5069_660027 [Mesorhizobium escarrei]|uniref:Uncharacterized protein n=1 Tax=Mesorhizobium escarrei TaxID=666018 RepID=A0ABN8KHH8_9HYPH|nr:hypothetical protein MES5069_660027 [Mesorhizobium escarrei]
MRESHDFQMPAVTAPSKVETQLAIARNDPRRPAVLGAELIIGRRESLKASALDHGARDALLSGSRHDQARSAIQCRVSAAQLHLTAAQVSAHSPLSGGPALLLLPSDNALRLGQECDARSQASAPIVCGWRSHIVPTCIDFSQMEACSPAVDVLAIELAKLRARNRRQVSRQKSRP